MKVLYVTDRAAVGDTRFDRVLEALCGAPGLLVQLRERTGADRDRELLERARSARVTLGPAVGLFVNRRLDVALAAGCSGSHPLPTDSRRRESVDAPRGFRVRLGALSAEARGPSRMERPGDGPNFRDPFQVSFGRRSARGPRRAPGEHSHGAEVSRSAGSTSALAGPPLSDRIWGSRQPDDQEADDPRAVVERISAA